jgi:hypothetical protein
VAAGVGLARAFVRQAKLVASFRVVVEADIKGFFDNIDHDKLLEMPEKHISHNAAWCKTHCHLPKPVLFAKINHKLRGYWQYYGIRGNDKSLHDFFHPTRKILYKWLNRRSQKRSYNIAGFRALLEDFRLIKPRICHNF